MHLDDRETGRGDPDQSGHEGEELEDTRTVEVEDRGDGGNGQRP